MAKVKSKGTVLAVEIASVFTPIAQIISIDAPEAEVEDFDATTLDTVGAGKEYDPTGYVEGGECGWEMFFDPSLSGHRFLTGRLTTPVKDNWKLTFPDTVAWPFNGFVKKGGATVAMGDGLKGKFSVKLSGLITYPT